MAAAVLVMFARMAESGIASIRPAPRVGVGIRNTMLELPPCPESGFPAGVNRLTDAASAGILTTAHDKKVEYAAIAHPFDRTLLAVSPWIRPGYAK
jgi:hypothetical protein